MKDLVTGVVGYSINNDGAIDTQDGTHAWKAIGSNYFEKVISKDPASLGFEHVNYAVIPEKTVDANTKDQEIQVIYSGTTKNPDKPSEPSKPDKPETPNKPDKPSEPSKPTKPETPNKPDKPSQPTKPNKPEVPNKSDKTSFSPLARRNSPLVNEKTNTLESSKDSTKTTKNRTVNSSKELPQTSSNTQQSINDEVIGSVALSIGLIGLAGVKKRKNAR